MTDDTYTWTNADGISVTVPGVHRRAAESHLAGDSVRAFVVGDLIESTVLTSRHFSGAAPNPGTIVNYVYDLVPLEKRRRALDRIKDALYGDHNPNAGIWLRVGAILREELEGVAVT